MVRLCVIFLFYVYFDYRSVVVATPYSSERMMRNAKSQWPYRPGANAQTLWAPEAPHYI